MPRWWVADAQATARQAVEDNTAYYLRGESSAGVDTSHYDGLAGREATAALLPQYAVRLDQLSPLMRAAFHPLTLDAGTREWMQSTQPSWWGGVLAAPLRWLGYGTADINAMLGAGHMHVLSPQQVQGLLGDLCHTAMPHTLRLLDVGAGAGEVTQRLVQGLAAAAGGDGRRVQVQVTATDTSDACVAALQSLGHTALASGSLDASAHTAFAKDGAFDVVAGLNVLDRCSHPVSLLRDMVRLLAPGGHLLLALVLPWDDFVEVGGVQRRPAEALPMSGARCGDRCTLEHALRTFLARVLGIPFAPPAGDGAATAAAAAEAAAPSPPQASGSGVEKGSTVIPRGTLTLQAWSRVPYLSQGDMANAVYWLPNAVLVLRKADGEEGV